MITLNINNKAALTEGALYGINLASHYVDIVVVVILGALVCIITGIVYGIFTNWGFFKYRWLIAKWLLTTISLTSAMLFLAPGEEVMLELSKELGNQALQNQAYLIIKAQFLFWSIVQVVLLTLMIICSVFKPWGKRKTTKKLTA